MIIAVDIGNTNIVLGLFSGGSLEGTWRLASDMRRTADEYTVLIDHLLRRSTGALPAVETVVIGSVVPVLSDTLDEAIRSLFSFAPYHVTHATPMPVANRYGKPHEVGVDRLANAVGGVSLYGAPLIVVDVGTAITLDVITREREYIGGAILPGIELSAEALARRTARLPRVAPHEPQHAIGRSTVESIRSGLLNGMIGAVDRLIEESWNELGYETATVATGGLAKALVLRSRHVSRTNNELTLRGLVEIYRVNATPRHDS